MLTSFVRGLLRLAPAAAALPTPTLVALSLDSWPSATDRERDRARASSRAWDLGLAPAESCESFREREGALESARDDGPLAFTLAALDIEGALESAREEDVLRSWLLLSALDIDGALERVPFCDVEAAGKSSSNPDPPDSVSVSLNGEEGKTFERSIVHR
jgi:hypothetical protein